MATGLIARLLGGPVQQDGAAENSEGVTAAARPQPPASRRYRPAVESDPICIALGQKVLHGWLQNRHQTLFPLTVNMRTMSPDQVRILAGVMAVAAHACGPVEPERVSAARAWFVQAGASPTGLGDLATALDDPPALSRVLDAALADGLAAYAFVMALVAVDSRDAASNPFLDYLAARLALPVTVVRSATRRYRR